MKNEEITPTKSNEVSRCITGTNFDPASDLNVSASGDDMNRIADDLRSGLLAWCPSE